MAQPRRARPEWRWRAAGSIADPRIEYRVEKVDREIDQHVDEAEQKYDALDDRIVAPQDGIDGQPAEPRDGEHALGHHGAADQQRDADADHGDDWDRRVLQRMDEQDRTLRQPL